MRATCWPLKTFYKAFCQWDPQFCFVWVYQKVSAHYYTNNHNSTKWNQFVDHIFQHRSHKLLHTAHYRVTENFKPSSFNGECAQSHSGWHNLSSVEVRESTDFGNLSAVNLKPVTFEIGIDIMPHERKINHDLSSLTKFLLVQYQLR